MLAALQCTLTNNENGHRYGKSVSNQRIENWWSHQRRRYTEWLISYFKDMVDEGVINIGNNAHTECVWFVYSALLQSDLDNVRSEWNDHHIRKSNNNVLSGVPNQLYFLPETKGYENKGIAILEHELTTLTNATEVIEKAEEAENVINDDLVDYCYYIINELNLEHPPKDWIQAKFMYTKIVEHF